MGPVQAVIPGPSQADTATLGQAGRQLLGLAERSFRPSDEQAKARNSLFMDHTLATIDVLIAAERLCQTAPVAMPRLLVERQLRADPLRVELPVGEGRPARSVAVIPDAWFELAVGDRKPVAIAVELDRGSEDQKRWRGKVAALAAWAAGPYRQAFGNPTLTIAVVTPDAARRDTLRRWTAQELARIGQQELAEIFLVTSADPVTTTPAQLFFGRLWYEPATHDPVSLLTTMIVEACADSVSIAASLSAGSQSASTVSTPTTRPTMSAMRWSPAPRLTGSTRTCGRWTGWPRWSSRSPRCPWRRRRWGGCCEMTDEASRSDQTGHHRREGTGDASCPAKGTDPAGSGGRRRLGSVRVEHDYTVAHDCTVNDAQLDTGILQ